MVSEHASPLAVLGGEDAGGQNVYVAALACELARRGHEVVVHTRRDDPGTPRRVALCPGVVVDHVDAGPAVPIPKDDIWQHIDAFAADLASRWRERRPDLVHAHFWMSGVASLRGAAPQLPVLATFHALGSVKRRHQGAADTSPPGRVRAERWIVENADRILATCSDELGELRRLGASPARVSVIPCGVDTTAFRPDGPAWPRRGDHHRVVVVSRLVPRKGIDEVLRALADVPDTELLVAGGGPARHLWDDPEALRLRDVAANAGVSDRVQFLGGVARDEVPALLRSADVVVTTPWYEPFGIVPLEAMACGTPVVASAVGGILDSVVHGGTGLHVPPRDPSQLAQAIRGLLADPQLRRRMGDSGVRRVAERYSWRTVATSIVDAYERTLAERRRRVAVVA